MRQQNNQLRVGPEGTRFESADSNRTRTVSCGKRMERGLAARRRGVRENAERKGVTRLTGRKEISRKERTNVPFFDALALSRQSARGAERCG